MPLYSTAFDLMSTRPSWSCSITLFTLIGREIALLVNFALNWRYLKLLLVILNIHQHKTLLHKIVSFLLIYIHQMDFWLSVLFWISSWPTKENFQKYKRSGCKVFPELKQNWTLDYPRLMDTNFEDYCVRLWHQKKKWNKK